MDQKNTNTATQSPQFGFTADQSGKESHPQTPVPPAPPPNPFAPSASPSSPHNTSGTKKKRFSTKTLLLIATTVLVGSAVPATVFIATNNESQDFRTRASEEAPITPPPYPTFAPKPTATPALSGCNQACSNHADCVAGYFCTDEKICQNALCPESNTCQCDTENN